METRRELISSQFGFNCMCELCVEQSHRRIGFDRAFEEAQRGASTLSNEGNYLTRMDFFRIKMNQALEKQGASFRFPIDRHDLAHPRKVAEVYFLHFGFIPANPILFINTAILLTLSEQLDHGLERLPNLSLRNMVLRCIYMTFFLKEEFLALPTAVQHTLISNVLPAAVFLDEVFCDGFDDCIRELIRKPECDFRLLLIFQAFASSLLGGNLGSLIDMESRIREARNLWSADALAVDSVCTLTLDERIKANQEAMATFLLGLKKKRSRDKRKQKSSQKVRLSVNTGRTPADSVLTDTELREDEVIRSELSNEEPSSIADRTTTEEIGNGRTWPMFTIRESESEGEDLTAGVSSSGEPQTQVVACCCWPLSPTFGWA